MTTSAESCSKNVFYVENGPTSCLVRLAEISVYLRYQHLRPFHFVLPGTRRLRCSHKRVPCRLLSNQEMLLTQHCQGTRDTAALETRDADGLLRLVTELHYISNHPRLLRRRVRSSWCMEALQLHFPMLVQRSVCFPTHRCVTACCANGLYTILASGVSAVGRRFCPQ